SISPVLPCNENGIYLNLETKESSCLTVELSSAGFRVCGYQFDTLVDSTDDHDYDHDHDHETVDTAAADSQPDDDRHPNRRAIPLNVYYETPYALLDSISPAYRNLSSNELAQRLMELCK